MVKLHPRCTLISLLYPLLQSLSVALVPAQVQEVLADLPPDMRWYSTPAAAAQLRAALARLEGEQLPPADCPGHRSLEALRLEDPASMSGCWNPGYAAVYLFLPGVDMHTPVPLVHKPGGCAAC